MDIEIVVDGFMLGFAALRPTGEMVTEGCRSVFAKRSPTLFMPKRQAEWSAFAAPALSHAVSG